MSMQLVQEPIHFAPALRTTARRRLSRRVTAVSLAALLHQQQQHSQPNPTTETFVLGAKMISAELSLQSDAPIAAMLQSVQQATLTVLQSPRLVTACTKPEFNYRVILDVACIATHTAPHPPDPPYAFREALRANDRTTKHKVLTIVAKQV
eukprot:17895-Heterococcus_DN1.PRE.2